MKKLLVMVLVAVLASASTALAVGPTVLTNFTNSSDGTVGSAVDGTAGSKTIGSTPFAVSTNVSLLSTGNAGGYNVSAKHLSGDKNFISSSVSSSIEETSATKGVKMTALVLSSITANVYTGAGGY